MRYKNIISCVILIWSIVISAAAQVDMPAAGGNASGSGGSAAYSIGQVFFNVHTSEEGSITEGMQQPYEISVVTGMSEAEDISLGYRAYPNPVTDFLVLKAEYSDNQSIFFQLVDNNGRILESKNITANECIIPMEQYNAGTYYLNVISEGNKLKTFKIIKN